MGRNVGYLTGRRAGELLANTCTYLHALLQTHPRAALTNKKMLKAVIPKLQMILKLYLVTYLGELREYYKTRKC